LRDATVGLVGMGRIGQAIARRLEAFQVKVVYQPQSAIGRGVQALSGPGRHGA
jgi:phosphoglycerate dehydrogenase-like enzyme